MPTAERPIRPEGPHEQSPRFRIGSLPLVVNRLPARREHDQPHHPLTPELQSPFVHSKGCNNLPEPASTRPLWDCNCGRAKREWIWHGWCRHPSSTPYNSSVYRGLRCCGESDYGVEPEAIPPASNRAALVDQALCADSPTCLLQRRGEG